MYWCYQCEQNTQENQYSRVCDRCGSPAIELIQEGNSNNPSNFRPYIIGQNQNSLQNPQSQERQAPDNMATIEIPISFQIQTILIRSLDDPENITIIRRLVPVIGLPNQQKKTVNEQDYEKLPKIDFVSECAICQQDGKNGVKLPCQHNFHENCIKPWFSQANTCPCCRKQVTPELI